MVLRPRNGLSLCAGGGGLDMGLQLAEPGFHTRCYVEWEEYPQQTIIAGQRAGYFAPAPIWDDVTTFDGRPWRGHIDTILAGYPCQPFSQAGQRKGENDERHLWPEVARIIREVQPRWVFLENVAGHVSLGAETVLRELWDMGWTPAAGLFSAQEVGASHERLRWFCVAYRAGVGEREPHDTAGAEPRGEPRQGSGGRSLRVCKQLADPNGRDACPEREQRSGEQRLHPEGGRFGRGDVDHPASPRCDGTGQRTEADREGRERLSGAGCGELADASQPGSQGRERRGSPDEWNGAAAHGSTAECRGLSLFPPGPNEAAAWGAVLRPAPDMAPAASARDCFTWARNLEADGREWWEAAAEPEFRRMVDGVADRASKLRLLGNGVVPICAGYAWRSLADTHGLRPVDLEAACGDEGGGTDGFAVILEAAE